MAKTKESRGVKGNWLGPSTVLPHKVDADAGQPELINNTETLDAHGLDTIGYLPGKNRPKLRFAVKSGE